MANVIPLQFSLHIVSAAQQHSGGRAGDAQNMQNCVDFISTLLDTCTHLENHVMDKEPATIENA